MIKMPLKFEWDAGNLYKLNVINADRDISQKDIEHVFDDKYAFSKPSPHPAERRWKIVGRDLRGRILTVIFTKRKKKIRYVTAWKTNLRKEEYKTYLKRI
ncbi:MAG: BrnT family toxin [Chitinophagales bacterium]|nr:BrnT family toxin [Chitinophagales bacterium]